MDDSAQCINSNDNWRGWLSMAAADCGLVYLGAVPPEYPIDSLRFRHWQSEGKQAGMAYLNRHQTVRENPALFFSGANTVLVFGLPYFDGDRWPKHGEVFTGPSRVAQYARFRDYHKVLTKGLADIGRRVARDLGVAHEFRVAVDSAPLLERALASQCESGFIGKNTCFIHPEKGSFFLLGEIFTTLRLTPDPKITIEIGTRTKEGGCGRCNRCQVQCPTGALQTDYSIDARLCLSYWTIEHRGTIPERFWPHLRYYWFGCDICQLVCPYNLVSPPARRPSAFPSHPIPSLFKVATMTQRDYEVYFGGTPMTRAKRNGLRRNALIAMAVSQDPDLAMAMQELAADTESPIPETVAQIRGYLESQTSPLKH